MNSHCIVFHLVRSTCRKLTLHNNCINTYHEFNNLALIASTEYLLERYKKSWQWTCYVKDLTLLSINMSSSSTSHDGNSQTHFVIEIIVSILIGLNCFICVFFLWGKLKICSCESNGKNHLCKHLGLSGNCSFEVDIFFNLRGEYYIIIVNYRSTRYLRVQVVVSSADEKYQGCKKWHPKFIEVLSLTYTRWPMIRGTFVEKIFKSK